MIEINTFLTTVNIDHSAIIGIDNNISLNTTSIDKLNLRLIRASEYLQQFNLKLVHIKGKSNIVSDALSRLTNVNAPMINLNKDSAELDEIENYRYEAMILEIEPGFKEKIIEGYKLDPHFTIIIETVEENVKLEENAAKLLF